GRAVRGRVRPACAQGRVKGAGGLLDLLPSRQDEGTQRGRIDRPEIAPLAAEGVFEEEGPGVEERPDSRCAGGSGMGESAVARIFPPDLGIEIVQLGLDLLA